MLTRAIVRRPGSSFSDGLTSSNLGKPSLPRALEQHDAYIAALEQCGLEVTVLPADERYPILPSLKTRPFSRHGSPSLPIPVLRAATVKSASPGQR